MDAELILSVSDVLVDAVFQELVIWQVPEPKRGSKHQYKYRLALVADDVCVLRYDNEAGKGDHKHIGETETAYQFVDLSTLLADFDADVARWMSEHGYDQR
jgi:hypothetical protein